MTLDTTTAATASTGQFPFPTAATNRLRCANPRMRLAYAVDENVFDQSLLKKQRELMIAVYDSMQAIRQILHSHPLAVGYEIESHLAEQKIRMF